MDYKTLRLGQLDVSLSELRITRPEEQEKMGRSLMLSGQLSPVLTRVVPQGYQLLDGFKRYFAAHSLGWESLEARVVNVSLDKGKAMMLIYNKAGRSLLDYDEALVVYSLKKDHLLDQASISGLTGYSRSWVSRRLALVERLIAPVKDSLRLGSISHSHAREIVKLPRGNQQDMMGCIIRHQLSSRDSVVLVEQFMGSPDSKTQQYILAHPKEIIQRGRSKEGIYDARLSQHGNRLLKSVELLLLQQNIFTGLCSEHMTHKLSDMEKGILTPRIAKLGKGAMQIGTIIKDKTWKDER